MDLDMDCLILDRQDFVDEMEAITWTWTWLNLLLWRWDGFLIKLMMSQDVGETTNDGITMYILMIRLYGWTNHLTSLSYGVQKCEEV